MLFVVAKLQVLSLPLFFVLLLIYLCRSRRRLRDSTQLLYKLVRTTAEVV